METAAVVKKRERLALAVQNVASEFSLNTKEYMNFWFLWTDKQKGVAKDKDGFDFLQEGVFVFIDDTQIVVRQVVDNAMNAGEITLTGFATRNLGLIQGAIESALEF